MPAASSSAVRSASIAKGEIVDAPALLEGAEHHDDHDDNKITEVSRTMAVVPSSPTRETTATTTTTTASEEDEEYCCNGSFERSEYDGDDGDDDDLEASRRGRGVASSPRPGRDEHAYCDEGGSTLDNIEVVRHSYSLAVGAAAGSSVGAAIPPSGSGLKRSGVDLYVEALHPPPSQFEKRRDALLRFLDTPAVQAVGVLVLLLVVVDGAVFFFFLMGWQTLCHDPSPTNCEPRNAIYNASVQILTVLFTIMTVLSLPWRLTQASHAFGVLQYPRRPNGAGRDIYGVPSNDVWYHIPLGHRRFIVTMLLLNCFTQYLNQAARIVFNSYQSQSTFPGTLFVNVFFAASFVCAFVGGVYMAVVSERVRRRHPERFGPGPIQIFLASDAGQKLCRCVGCCACCCCCDVQVAKLEVEAQEREIEEAVKHDASIPYDPTSSETRVQIHPPLARRGSRTELRMFAM